MEGVGKLIELLNDYEIWKGKNGLDIRQQYSEHNFKYNKWLYNIVISKKYGFIKRLVDNDKIDVNKVKKEFYNNICITEYGDEDRVMGDDNLVIAVLSISDSPIKFLCSILK